MSRAAFCPRFARLSCGRPYTSGRYVGRQVGRYTMEKQRVSGVEASVGIGLDEEIGDGQPI